MISSAFIISASVIVSGGVTLLLLAGGLLASFFHLGRPERAWRAASQWRTSWLSREVIVLPAFMGIVFVYGALHLLAWRPMLVILRSGAALDATRPRAAVTYAEAGAWGRALVLEASYTQVTIGAYRSSIDGRQLRANPALVRLNGYDSEPQMLAAVNDIAQE